jgi:hypothetical protein
MEWGKLKCWQPRQLVVLPEALYSSGWEYLQTQPHHIPTIARLEAVTVHVPVFPETLMQVMSYAGSCSQHDAPSAA